ncbi:MAG: GlxA family transcriptional regulator, partial [Pseudomonadota bacterium]
SLMAFASTFEPLRTANTLSDVDLYSWQMLSAEGGLVPASAGLQVMTERTEAATPECPDLVVVCAGVGGDKYRSPALEGALRRFARHGVAIAAVSTGSFILARAGLLNDRPCTIHWDYMDAFVEAFPELDVRSNLFIIDGDRITCAGGSAALDLMLQLIRMHHGDTLAQKVSDQFVHGQVRDAEDQQRQDIRHRYSIVHPLLIQAVGIMEETIEDPVPKSEISRRVGISMRQLERLFKHNIGVSPSRFYLTTRLERARKLLRHTSLPITEVAFASGFETASHFAKCYRDYFNMRPSDDRQPAETTSGVQVVRPAA